MGQQEDVQAHALRFVLIDILAQLYLASPDPTQTAVNHRAQLRKIMTETPIAGFDARTAELIKGMMAKEVDAIVELAGKSASRAEGRQINNEAAREGVSSDNNLYRRPGRRIVSA